MHYYRKSPAAPPAKSSTQLRIPCRKVNWSKPLKTMPLATLLLLANIGVCTADSASGKRESVIEAARQAYVYGYPMVDSYKVLHDYSLDPKSPEYLAPLNAPGHIRSVSTPQNKAVIAPNVDTPYTWTWFDLRTEPVVITIPNFEPDRYVSLQLFDTYSYIIDYVTPRTNGNVGGKFLLAGPGWQGNVPRGITRRIDSTSSLALGLTRTQILDKDGLAGVHRIQDGFRVEPLSVFLGNPRPRSAPSLVPVPTLNLRERPFDPQFFRIMNWMLFYSPVLTEDLSVRKRFAEIGICGGCRFEPDTKTLKWIEEGMHKGMADMTERAKRVKSSAELFGSRDFLKQDYLVRAVGAMLGIYGNAAEEYLGVGFPADNEGRAFDGNYRYTVKFGNGGFPPVGAFWSITAYDQQRLLYANPLNRYVINSAMIPNLKKDADGSYTLYIQHDSPGKDRESNWLPVPNTPFTLTFRTYLPGQAVRDGTWRAPPVIRKP